MSFPTNHRSDTLTSYTYETRPTFSVEMTKTAGEGYAGSSPDSGQFRVSYTQMPINIDYTLVRK